MADFDFEEMMKSMGMDGGKTEKTHLQKTHPHFDSYPQYLKNALIANERLQGRMK